MSDVIEKAKKRTIVVAQIEEKSGVDFIEDIASVSGLDAVFLGPSDLSLSYGETNLDSQFLIDAMIKVGAAAVKNKINYITFITDLAKIKDWKKYGFTTYVLGSEQAWIMKSALEAVETFQSTE
jgi:2-keto-3-deoxy-L-rhamnonate aldolase RhmA|tara:strand:- start:2001 stop:2372 length:372 start_codon:yes stop_codon:yes gene_type:complete